MKKRYLPIILAVIFFGLVANGHAFNLFERIGIASSPNPVGSGARAIGMGGAFIAIADDATAASWNPAGLIQLERPELSIVGAYTTRTEDFASGMHPESDNSASVDDTNLNYASATYPFNFLGRNMVVSANYQRLYEFKRSFDYQLNLTTPMDPPLTSTQNRHYDQNGSLSALGLAYAVEITPRLSLGATLNIWTDDLCWENGWEETFAGRSITTFGASSVMEETFIVDKYIGFSGLNVNIGFLWNAFSGVTIGAVLKTPFSASVDNEYHEQWTQWEAATGQVIDSGQVRNSENIDVDMPISYGLGLAWRLSDQLSLAADIYRTHWSQFIVTDSQGNETSGIGGRAETDSDVGDTTQVRLGGEYLVIMPTHRMVIPLRAGLFYDPEPSHDGTNDFYGISMGSGLGYKSVIVDLAYQLRWGRDIETNNLIANSSADITQQMVLLSLIYHF